MERRDITNYLTMDRLMFLVLSMLVASPTSCEELDQYCPPRQNLELGKEGIIRCSFEEDYYGIYWYNTEDLTDYAFLYYENGQKGGHGYDSKEFDVEEDGSLVIKTVDVKHEILFTVAYMRTQNDNPVQKEVRVTTISHPKKSYPVIERCVTKQYCFTKLKNSYILTCSISDTRPAIHVGWSVRTTLGDHNVTLEMDILTNGDVFTTIAKMKYQHFSPLKYHLFVCNADDKIALLEFSNSVVLAEVGLVEIDYTKVVYKEVIIDDTITMSCPDADILFFVWNKMRSQDNFEIIAHGYLNGKHSYDQLYEVDYDGVLVIKEYQHDQDGIYVCYASNGIQEHMTTYNVTHLDHVTGQPVAISSVTVDVTPVHIGEEHVNAVLIVIATIPVVLVVICVLLCLYRKGKPWRCGCVYSAAKDDQHNTVRGENGTTTPPLKNADAELATLLPKIIEETRQNPESTDTHVSADEKKVIEKDMILFLEGMLNTFIDVLQALPKNMRLFSCSLRSLYTDNMVGSSSNAAKKMNKLRDVMTKDASLYVKVILPISQNVVKSVKECFEYYDALDLEEWREFIPELLGKVREYKQCCTEVARIHEVIMIPLKIRQDEAMIIISELQGFTEKMEIKKERMKNSSQNKITLTSFLPHLPMVNKLPFAFLNTSADMDLVRHVGDGEQCEINKSASLVVGATMIPALSAFIDGLNAGTEFFSVIEQHLVYFQGQEDKVTKNNSRLHYSMMRERAATINTSCSKFYDVLPAVRTDLKCIPDKTDNENYIEKWISGQYNDILKKML